MAQGILNAKLDELDRQLRKIHRKIQKSGSANPARLRADLEQVRKEYAENEKALRNPASLFKIRGGDGPVRIL